MTATIDVAGRVRPGEELDVAAVDAWLKARVGGLSGTPEVTQYAGGASNWTYRLAYPDGDPEHDFILRRPPAGTKAKGAHDMGREYRIQSALKPVYPYVPEMIAHCDDESVIGAEFYVMRRLRGMIPRRNLPSGVALTPEQGRAMCLAFVDRLIELHQVDVDAAGLRDLGKGAGYVKRQIDGWCARYEKARTWNVPRWSGIMRWLGDNQPDDVATCVIHNDFRLDNTVFDADDPTRVIGILDWELATLGCPLMDLGNTMSYWIQADDGRIAAFLRRQPSHLPGMLSRREIVDYYCDRTGYRIVNWAFYEAYGLFRLAVILQQIYYRYHHRQTRNPAFRNFWLMNHFLYWRCRGVLKQAR